MRQRIWKEVLQRTLPVGMGYLPTGFAFGVLAVQAGLSSMLAMAMSIFIFAGALQFAAISMLASPAGLGAFVLTTLLVNLRHVLYAIPLIDHLPRRRLSRAYVVAALTDENYSVLTTLPSSERLRLATRITLCNHAYWIVGTGLGVALGAQAGRWIPNLDFALPALFTILAIEQYLVRRRWMPIMVGLMGYLIAAKWFSGYELLFSLAFGLVILVVCAIAASSVPRTEGAKVDSVE
ncbi:MULTISPECIES: AzlC family ABC transporter permease [unclassified Variovorax]|uniref:AzlC family ABC transporter permease n=1 Tax=unclassified Variovorax TaxID=663243 RepID=UPI0025777FDD|nr:MULTISPECIES: AzlC family ABC transporter permease [unclassified Variovorax]MDM0088662.1 AzlC family ABC transporter permease [Variovorax sp. J22G40]MDM0146735.1 AzlC family ABC transporter permease [Variovorax sp. J2P1-31]